MADSDQWKKTYELNEEAWRKWYREQNRARKNRPLPLLLFVFSTVIQFPLILLYVVRTQMQAGEAAVLLLLSASLGLLACFNRYASKTYAHFRLKQPDPSRQYGTCRIRIQKENVWICKPGKTVEAPAAALKMECGRSGLVAISDANSMLTFIPGDAFCSADERKDMLGAFEEARKNCYRRSEDELAECVPKACMADYEAAVQKAVRTEWERTAWRGLIRTSVWWTPATVLSAGISAAILLYLLSAQRSGWAILLVFLLILLNLQYIMLFTPWVDRQIEQANRNLVSLLGNGKIRYCFDDKRLVMIGNQMAFDFPRQDVAAVRCYQKFGVWYLRNGLILIIPKGETMNDPSFKTLLNWNMTRS